MTTRPPPNLSVISLSLALLALAAACEAVPTDAARDGGGNGPMRGTQPGTGGGDTISPAGSGGASGSGGAPGSGGSAVVDAGAELGASLDATPIDGAGADTAPPKPPGTMCRVEALRDARMLAFAGGPNFGSGAAVGLCGFANELLPKGRHFGAVDSALFQEAGACGACMRVQNADGTLTADVQIIDLVDPMFPGSEPVISADLDVQRIFSPAGNPEVKFKFVPCEVTGNIRTAFDTTTTTNSSLLVTNYRTTLAKVEIETAAGWKALERTRFNRWKIPFTIDKTSNAVRFTDVSGREAQGPMVPFLNVLSDSNAQFPECLP